MAKMKIGLVYASFGAVLIGMLWLPVGTASCDRGTVAALFGACKVIENPPR